MLRPYRSVDDLGLCLEVSPLAEEVLNGRRIPHFRLDVVASVLGTDGEVDTERRHRFHIGHLKVTSRAVTLVYGDGKSVPRGKVTVPKLVSRSSRKRASRIGDLVGWQVAPRNLRDFRGRVADGLCRQIHDLLTVRSVMTE